MRGLAALFLLAGCGHGLPPASAPPFTAVCAFDAGAGTDAGRPSWTMSTCDGVGECVVEGQHTWIATYAHGDCVSGRCVLQDPPTWTYCEHGCVSSGTSAVRCARPGPTAP